MEKIIKYIKENPNGITSMFGSRQFLYEHPNPWNAYTNNCHNVFLNHMFRFSIIAEHMFDCQ